MENEKTMENKKNKKGLLALVLVLIIAIAVGAVYFINTSKKASQIFTSELEKIANTLINTETPKIEKTKITLSANVELNGATEYKAITDIISKLKIEMNSQRDFVQKTQYVELSVLNDNQEIIKGNVYYTDSDNNVYVYVKDVFDKYFKLPIDEILDEETLESFNKLLNVENAENEYVDISKVKDILISKINEKLIEDYFKQENVDGAKKTTLKMTFTQFKNIVTEIGNELLKDDEFLKCFKNQEEVKESITELLKTLEDEDLDMQNMNLEISLYTKGLLKNDLVKVEVIISDDDNTLKMYMNKVATDKFEFIVEMPEMGKITFNIEYSNTPNAALDKIDISNNIDFNDLSKEDMMTIYNNLMNSPIYSYIMSLNSIIGSGADMQLESDEEDYNYSFNLDDYDLDDYNLDDYDLNY